MLYLLVIGLVLGLLALLGVVLACFVIVLAFLQAERRGRVYRRLEMKRARNGQGTETVRVKWCSEPRFHRFWKLFPWEAAGFLTVLSDRIVFEGELTSGVGLSLLFDKRSSTIEFVGTRFWPNGLSSWLRIGDANARHYFTPETGVFVLRSASECRRLFERLLAVIG